jgi:type IV secretory pathway TrbF-like protein
MKLGGLFARASKSGATALEVANTRDVASTSPGARHRLPEHEVECYPWLAGAMEYSERYGTLIDEKRVAYRVAAGAMFIAFAAVIGMIVVGVIFEQGRHVVPWIVQVDKTNWAVSMGPAEQLPEVSELASKTSAARWIRAMRSVRQTAEAQVTDVAVVYSMLAEGSAATKKATAWFLANNPMESVGTKQVEVEITGVHSTRDSQQFTVNWVERASSNTGSVERQFTADVRFMRSAPRTFEEAERNLLGLFVSDYSITELTPGS